MSHTTTKVRAHAAAAQTASVRPLVVSLIGLLAGLAVLLYPVVATQWNNIRANYKAQAYSREVDSLPKGTREAIIDAARHFNEVEAKGPVDDPWSRRTADQTPKYRAYLTQLALNDTLGRLVIPAIKVDLPIYHGTSDDVLDKGIGHLYGSSLPIGGDGTHSVLTGHTGFNNQTLFDNLDKLRENDEFFVETLAGQHKYKVDQIKIVTPDNKEDLQIVPGKDLVTLVTCTPYGINSHRLLVRGHRVAFEPAVDQPVVEKTNNLVWQQWMLWVLGASAVVLLIVAFLLVQIARRLRTRAANRRDVRN